MLTLITIISILATACLCCLLYDAIQPGEALGIWSRKVLTNKLYNDHPLLEKFLGGCMKCFSHFISILAFPMFLFIQWKLDLWIGWWNAAIYFVFVPFSIILAQVISGAIKKLNS